VFARIKPGSGAYSHTFAMSTGGPTGLDFKHSTWNTPLYDGVLDKIKKEPYDGPSPDKTRLKIKE
jgi:hypothetical protein